MGVGVKGRQETQVRGDSGPVMSPQPDSVRPRRCPSCQSSEQHWGPLAPRSAALGLHILDETLTTWPLACRARPRLQWAPQPHELLPPLLGASRTVHPQDSWPPDPEGAAQGFCPRRRRPRACLPHETPPLASVSPSEG